MRAIRNQGVTLIELLLGIVLFVIVSAFAVPSFQSFILSRKVINMKDSSISALRFAQSQASKSSFPIVICATADFSTCSNDPNDWKKGWVVIERSGATTNILRVYQVPNVDLNGFTFGVARFVSNPPGPVSVTELEFVPGGLPAIGYANAVMRVCNNKSRQLFQVFVRPSGVIDEVVSTVGVCPP